MDYQELLRTREEDRARLDSEIQRLREAELNRALLDEEIRLLKLLTGLKDRKVMVPPTPSAPRTRRNSLPARALILLQERNGGPMPLADIASELATRHGYEPTPEFAKRMGHLLTSRPTLFRFVSRSLGWTLTDTARVTTVPEEERETANVG